MNLQTYLMIKQAATYSMSMQGSNQVHPAARPTGNGGFAVPQEVFNQYTTLGPGERWAPGYGPDGIRRDSAQPQQSVPFTQQGRPMPHSNPRMIPPPIVPGRPQQMQQQRRYQPQQQIPTQRPINSRKGQLQSYSATAPGADEFL